MRRYRSSRCLFGMIVVLTIGFNVRAQTSSPPPEKNFFKDILQDQKAIWTAPFHLQREDAKWVIPGSIGLMALFTTDRITGDEIAEFDAPVKTSRAVSYAGSVYGLAAVAGTFYLVGRKHDDARARETGVLSAEALVDSVIVESALKGITQRARPMTGVERSEFFDGGSSFPSGHSTQAWAVAAIIAHEYRDKRAVQVAAYGAASAVSLARLGSHKHYISDVVAGSAMGYVIGKYVYDRRHREFQSSVSEWRPMITPQFDRRAHQYGLALTWSF